MTIQDLGSIGEFVAAIATLATLAYLAAQIRQNTRSIRASAFQTAQRDVADIIDGLSHDPDLTRVVFDGLREFESFSTEDRRRFATFLAGLLRRYENLLHQTRLGSLDPSSWGGLLYELRRIFAQPGARAWWVSGQRAFNRELQDFIEREVIGFDLEDSSA